MNSPESTVSSSIFPENDVSLDQALFAGCNKNFVGTGPRKISKAQIKELNTSKLTKTVYNIVENSNSLRIPLTSTYCLGICRIYDKAVDFLLEDLTKFNDELNIALLGNQKSSKSNKKNKKSTTEQAEQDRFLEVPNQSFEVCDEAYFVTLFGRNLETDRNLLHEIDIPSDPGDYFNTLGNFGDELHLALADHRVGPSEWPSDEVAQLGQSIIENHQITDEGVSNASEHAYTPAVIPETSTETSPRSRAQRERRDKEAGDRPTASTPKRKTRQPLDETPTKRQRISSTQKESNTVRRLFSENGQSSPAPANIEGSSAAQGFFEQNGQSSITPAHEIMRHNADGNETESFHEHMPIEMVNEEPRRSSTHQVNSGLDVEQERESMTPAVDVSENNQLQPNQLIQSIDNMELEILEESNNESLTPKRPKRLKKWMERDIEKKIPPPLDITQRELYINVHTRPWESRLFNPHQKESVASLFSLPATRLKTRGPCPFGKPLLNLYSEMARPILHINDEESPARPSLPSSPRDVNVNRRSRFSSFWRDRRSRSTVPSMSGDQNVTSEGGNDNNEDRDRQLMPPPSTSGRASVTLPDIHIEPPSSPNLGQQHQSPHQSPQRPLPRTPTRPPLRPDTPAVSPRQSPSALNNYQPILAGTPDDNLNNPPDLPFDDGSRTDRDDSDRRSHRLIYRSPSSLSMTSERERSLLMEEDAFYQFLKSKWAEMLDKVDLHSIIPRRSTPVAFFRYFVFLQRLQKAGKLMMLQEIIYGQVLVVRERTRQLEEITCRPIF